MLEKNVEKKQNLGKKCKKINLRKKIDNFGEFSPFMVHCDVTGQNSIDYV